MCNEVDRLSNHVATTAMQFGLKISKKGPTFLCVDKKLGNFTHSAHLMANQCIMIKGQMFRRFLVSSVSVHRGQ